MEQGFRVREFRLKGFFIVSTSVALFASEGNMGAYMTAELRQALRADWRLNTDVEVKTGRKGI